MVESLVKATGREPIVTGKPTKQMLDTILRHFHLNPERTCMIGDRLDTDIRFGKQGNLSTAAVLSGVSTQQEVSESQGDLRPDFVMPDISVLLQAATKTA